eukprot:GFUD01003497.1.p1 GENE.GFUD01003497.1~~GFUD01003497.1.p1  ORF type:complete len:665 (+),score=233.31 GFUD01003497.1:1632-3626(+)
MNLLPKDSQEFHQKEYWDNFFKKRGKKAFEWYGEYHELCGILHKYSRAVDNILQVGCGNSSLASDLYDVGYRNIRSIDISDLVIAQMSQQNRHRGELIFEKMDVTDMRFKDEEFSVVLDKGTLDALFTDTTEEVVTKVEQMWEEISRVLRVGGRYLCVSLLQSHILSAMVTWFSSRGWPVRVIRCVEADQSKTAQERVFPVFVVVATKFKPSSTMRPVLELSLSTDGQISRLGEADSLVKSVRGCQQFCALRARLAGGGDQTIAEASLDLWEAGQDKPRYSLFLAERKKQSNIMFAAFIVPQGREVEWMFATAEGRAQLCDSASCSRLVVVHLARDNTFSSLVQVQEELAGPVLELAPDNLPSKYQVPFLSAGSEQVGDRVERCRGQSTLSGQYVVEDVCVGVDHVRRLIFLSRPHLTQSEAILKSVKGKNKKTKKVADLSVLASSYHGIMVGSLGIYLSAPCKVLVVGLGGGSLPNYIHSTFPLSNVHVVEIDPAIVRVAQDQFSFTLGDRLTVSTSCGLAYIKNSVEQYNIIMLDVDSKDISSGMSCPPPSFLEPHFLDLLCTRLVPGGMLVLNLVCRDSVLRGELMEVLAKVWPSVISYKLEEEVNEIVFCSSNEKLKSGEVKKTFSQAFKLVNDHVKKATRAGEDLIDLEEALQLLKVSH